MYSFITNLFPKKIKEHYNKLFLYAGVKVDGDKFLGFLLTFSVTSSLIIALFLSALLKSSFIFSFVISFIILHLAFYFTFSFKGDSTAKFVENALPDALQLMTSNLRAGLTTDKALILSARPEFGPLSEGIKLVGKKISLGQDLTSAMAQMTLNIKSKKLEKVINLINSGIKSGGQLTEILEQSSKNLRQEKFLEEKVRSSVLMYTIFIFFAIAIGTPILFGLSTFLTNVLDTTLSSVDIPNTQIATPITFSEISIEPSFVFMFAIINLITTSILGSLVIGLINKGREKAGVKYIPILMSMSLIIFFLARFLIKSLLGELFGI